MMKVNELRDKLKDHGINPSFQRIKILQYLMGTKAHPTVDVIYKHILNEIPTLSKTTIYNTLKTFVEKGLVLELTIDENEARYDFDTSNHAHFKCVKCKSVIDVDDFKDFYEKETINGNKIYVQHFYFSGICKECV